MGEEQAVAGNAPIKSVAEAFLPETSGAVVTTPGKKQLVWLITGTSTGLGKELTLAALVRGEKVIATARSSSIQKLDELKERGAATLELDVTWPVEKIKEAVTKAESIYGRIDVLVNNAGFGWAKPVEEEISEDAMQIFNTNVFGGLAIAQIVLPGMRARKEGTIVWIGSIAGWQPIDYTGLYSTTKGAARSLSETLHKEIAPFGLRSIIFELGHFRTEILKNGVDVYSREEHIPDYSAAVKKLADTFTAFHGHQPGDTKVGAEIIVDVVKGEGIAEGKEVPSVLPLGSDCFAAVESVCKQTLRMLEEWKDVILSTDYVKAESKGQPGAGGKETSNGSLAGKFLVLTQRLRRLSLNMKV